MRGSKTILVPIDFQDASLEALAMAQEIASGLDLEVVLVHVYAVPVSVYPAFKPILAPDLTEEAAAAARASLDKLAAEHGGLRSAIRVGDPATEILKMIEETRPTFIAMGTHGRKGLSHVVLGSVAEKVVRLSQAPVLTVHARAEPWRQSLSA